MPQSGKAFEIIIIPGKYLFQPLTRNFVLWKVTIDGVEQ